MKRNKLELAGFIDVDAGLVQVGDPCYTSEGRNHADDWGKFCDFLGEFKDVTRIPHEAGNPGKALVISGFGGDGSYPVFIKRDDTGLIMEIRVVFNE